MRTLRTLAAAAITLSVAACASPLGRLDLEPHPAADPGAVAVLGRSAHGRARRHEPDDRRGRWHGRERDEHQPRRAQHRVRPGGDHGPVDQTFTITFDNQDAGIRTTSRSTRTRRRARRFTGRSYRAGPEGLHDRRVTRHVLLHLHRTNMVGKLIVPNTANP
jgi:hypothetical protein